MVRPSRCPICRKDVPVLDADAPHRPFCSPRCKSIDLGSWLGGHYRISRPLDEEELDAGAMAPPDESSDLRDEADGGGEAARGAGRPAKR